MRPVCIIMVGIPGSGKSTYTRERLDLDKLFQYSTDDLIEKEAARLGSTYDEVFPDYIGTATKLAHAGLQDAIREKRNILWDQTNMSAKKRRKIINTVGRDYYFVVLFARPPSTDQEYAVLEKRLDSRPGKTIPQHVVFSMIDTFDDPTLDSFGDDVKYTAYDITNWT